jgi:NAD(P)-dependent dehydrogenase (short-subunit alcohol dehydrogenase family)
VPPDASALVTGVDLRGRRALVTGGTGGLGEETVAVLATVGAEVIVAGRTREAATAACVRIVRRVPQARLVPVAVDLADLASVRACAAEVLADGSSLHLLVANAGVMAVPEGRTADGFETHIGVNHLGHFALVTALEEALVAGAPARVVVLSSAGHRWEDVDLDHLAEGQSPYRRFRAYGASKTANVLFAVELDRRWRDRGVRAFAVHPGGIRTGLGRHLDDADRQKLSRGAAAQGTSFRTVAQGAATSVWAAVSPELDGRGGLYLEDCAVAPVTGPEASSGVRGFALDPERAARMWTLSEQLVGAR